MAKLALAAGVCAVAAGAAYGYSQWRQEDDEDEDVEQLPVVSREEVVAIFTRLTEIMNATISQAMRRINAQRSQQLPQEIIAQYLLEHFEGQLKEAQAHVFNEFKHDEEDVEEAVAYYDGEGDEEVIEAVNQLRQLYMNIGGSIELDLPEDLTLDKMCTVFEEYMAAVVAAQHAFTAHLHTVKARGGQITSQELNATRQNKIAQHVSVVLQKHGLNNLIFQAAIEKYNDHPQFQAKIASVKAQSDSNGR